jgi:integrase
VKLPNGKVRRVFGTPNINTKADALRAEKEHIARVEAEARGELPVEEKEVPTYQEWFWGKNADAKEPDGRFWKEWVVANKNKPSECRTKKIVYRTRLKQWFARVRLDKIDAEAIAGFRAALVEAKLSAKRINNILAVLSKSLRWAEEVELIKRSPRIRFYKVEQPEIEFYDFAEYTRILDAAKRLGPRWYAAICLAGEAGLRVGEVKAIRWREDIDLVARTITVNQQVHIGHIGTPKGRTRRTIPMTDRLYDALKAISTVREGLLLRRTDGEPLTDSYAHEWQYRTCRLARLPERGWHVLRHSFATHSAMFGVNPWTLNAWLGHKTMEETMRYVHVAEHHQREIPKHVQQAGDGEPDVTRRVVKMLGARATVDGRGTVVAQGREGKEKREVNPLFQ